MLKRIEISACWTIPHVLGSGNLFGEVEISSENRGGAIKIGRKSKSDTVVLMFMDRRPYIIL